MSILPVAYVVSNELVKVSSLLPSNKNRSVFIHSLISALRLLSNNDGAMDESKETRTRVLLLKPTPADYKDLAVYHSSDYVHLLLNSTALQDQASSFSEYGLEDDCPPFPGLSAYACYLAGATLTASQSLRNNESQMAICWDGGRHHAQKSKASGFCYINDCVLAVLTLGRPIPNPSTPGLLKRPRIMYLDLDLHFSDGVASAFYSSAPTSSNSNFLHISIHHSSPGFFPPPTPPSSLPETAWPGFNPFFLSIPLQQGASNSTFAEIWPIVDSARDIFNPDYVVIQCGVDGLAGDPCGIWNWGLGGRSTDKGGDQRDEIGSIGWCVRRIKEWDCKKLFLGGGGYNSPNAARAYAYLTSILIDRPLPLTAPIPLSHSFFPAYSPSFTVDVPPGNMQDTNSDEYLREVKRRFQGALRVLEETVSRT